MERIASSDPTNAVWQREAVAAQFETATALLDQKRFKEARTEVRKYYPAIVRFAADDPLNTELQQMAVVACGQIAILDTALKGKGDHEEAAQAVQQGLAILKALEKRGPLPPKSIEIRKMLEKIGRGWHF